MYCVIQFYIQLRQDLRPHSPFLKVLAIKLVIFLSFWQSFGLSILTSATVNIVKPTSHLAYPDLKVGVPSLLLCVEMAIFSILHLFAFPWKPYAQGAEPTKYPMSPTGTMDQIGPKQGGFLGLKAVMDAMNPWDLVKGFSRGMRWLFVGRKNRENDISYKASGFDINTPNENDVTLQPTRTDSSYKGAQDLPIAEEFRRSKFGMQGLTSKGKVYDEGAGLIAHAQPNPLNPGSYVPARQRYDANGQDISSGGTAYDNNPYAAGSSPDRLVGHNPTPGTIRRQENQQQDRMQSEDIGMAVGQPPEPYQHHMVQDPYTVHPQEPPSQMYLEQKRQQRQQQATPSEQWANSSRPVGEGGHPEVHNALWGQPPRQNQH